MMNKQQIVMFSQALDNAVKMTKELGRSLKKEIMLVRDLSGRIRVLLPGINSDYKMNKLNQFAQELAAALGAYGYPPQRTVLFADELSTGNDFFISDDRQLIDDEHGVKIYLLDRQIMGHDWMRMPLKRKTSIPRVTFYGIKGGVGRSTALIIWAWKLAVNGKKVLIVDIDLESPGTSSTLLPKDSMPDYGIVDWFVEDMVGQAEEVEKDMISSSPLAKNLKGEIRIMPAYGAKTKDYLIKLSRCYSQIGGDNKKSWAERLNTLVEHAEEKEIPDLVIIDSRAGLHDIAAVTATRMDATVFLFAVDSIQTWNAYTFLFEQWNKHPNINDFRNNLQIVASMIPETGREDYLTRFKENSWDLFREQVYTEIQAGELDEDFSYDLEEQDAPHYPLTIYWHRALQEFNPCHTSQGIDVQTAQEAMGEFFKGIKKKKLINWVESNE